MGTPVYQPAHGFRRGDPVAHNGESWVLATGAWDGVIGLVYDRDRIEILTSGFLDNLQDLTPGEVTYSGTVPLYRAITTTRALILAQSSGSSGSTSTVTNVTNTTTGLDQDEADDRYVLLPLAGGVLDIDDGNLVFDIDNYEQAVEE